MDPQLPNPSDHGNRGRGQVHSFCSYVDLEAHKMVISVAKSPTEGPAIIGKHLFQLQDRGGAPRGGSAPSASQPIEVFTVKLGDIRGPDFVSKAYPVAWRYFVLGQGAAAIADLMVVDGGAGWNFGGLTTGVAAEQLDAALRVADRLFGGAED